MNATQLADLCEQAGVEISEYYDEHDARIRIAIEVNNAQDLLDATGVLFDHAERAGLVYKLAEAFRNSKMHNPYAKMNQHNYIVFAMDWPF